MSRHPCILCGETAEREQKDASDDLYEYNCPNCGQYATREAGIAIWPTAPNSDRDMQIASIKKENARGRRPLI